MRATVGGWESCGRTDGGSGDHCPNQLPAEIVPRLYRIAGWRFLKPISEVDAMRLWSQCS